MKRFHCNLQVGAAAIVVVVVVGWAVVLVGSAVVVFGKACVVGFSDVVVVASVVVVTGQFTFTGRHMLHSNLKTRFPGHIWHADPFISVQVKNCWGFSGLA